MFSKRITRKQIRLTVFAAVVATLAVFAYVAPASTVAPASNMDRARFDDRLGIANTATIRHGGADLSQDAVDADGIEKDLDGNASALVPSDQLR